MARYQLKEEESLSGKSGIRGQMAFCRFTARGSDGGSSHGRAPCGSGTSRL